MNLMNIWTFVKRTMSSGGVLIWPHIRDLIYFYISKSINKVFIYFTEHVLFTCYTALSSSLVYMQCNDVNNSHKNLPFIQDGRTRSPLLSWHKVLLIIFLRYGFYTFNRLWVRTTTKWITIQWRWKYLRNMGMQILSIHETTEDETHYSSRSAS